MRLGTATLAIALALALVACGDDDSDVPDLGITAAEEAWECLEDEGYPVVGGRSKPTDGDAPDVELVVRSGDVPVFVAYYESEAEAERREPQLVKNVAAHEGSVLRRGSVAIVTAGLADAEDTAAVQGCVF